MLTTELDREEVTRQFEIALKVAVAKTMLNQLLLPKNLTDEQVTEKAKEDLQQINEQAATLVDNIFGKENDGKISVSTSS